MHVAIKVFQSTLPRRERPGGEWDCFNPQAFQSTLPRRERLHHLFPVFLFLLFQSTLPRRERPRGSRIRFRISLFQSTLPRRERQQFRPKIHSNFQQKSTNYHFIYLIFPFFHPLFFLHSTSFVHILECESPGIFMCASYSHSYIITKYIICCNSTIGTFFCFIYKSAPFL